MRKISNITFLAIPALATALTLSGCANDGQGGKEVGGTLTGAAIGGFMGSQIGGGGGGGMAATAIGTLLGAYIGNSIGRQLDEDDRRRMREAETRAYSSPLNEPITWNNPNNGNSGYITPIRDGHSESGAYCREFQSEVVVGGQRQNAHGTACREPDGSWRIVNG
ncbi:MAG: glycine zipper 2TM domain-containing protein [Rhodospirillaceae bacterium]|nr:MAG: glycine zipper 2TM domain-containing protein [Rhodospirillaceae bacterium]